MAAWLRAISAPLTRVRLARRDPVGDEAAERRERAQRLVEDVAAGHLEHDVDLGAVVGLAQRRRELRLAAVDRRVGAELEGERALLLGRGGRDDAGRRRSAWRAGRRAGRRRRPPRGPRRSLPPPASRLATGSITSLPVVLRACMSSWARRDLGEPVGLAPDDRRSSPLATSSNSSCSGSATIPGAAEGSARARSRSRPGCVAISAPLTTVFGSRRRDPVGDEAAERRQRPQRLRRRRGRRPSRARCRPSPPLASRSAAARSRLAGRRPPRRRRARGERALLLGRGGRDHPARRPCAWRAGRRASRPRRPPRGPRRSRPRASFAEVRSRCQAVRPWTISASAAVVRHAVGEREHRAGGRQAYSA